MYKPRYLLFIFSFFLISILLNVVSAYECVLYDDFSEDELNITRWEEIPGSDMNNLFVNEHYLDKRENEYHTAQLTQEDRGVTLKLLNKDFKSQDIIKFDLYYKSGEGNRISYIDIDGETKWWGLIGYWNEVQQGGNEFGKYKVEVKFRRNDIRIIVKNPNGEIIKIQGFPLPPGNKHTFGFGTRTGYNGLVHMDYDNVRICHPSNNTKSNLVTYWKLDEGNGSFIYDETNNGNNGVVIGNVSWTNDGISGTALELDGFEDKINILKTPSVDLVNKVNLEAYVKRKSADDGMIISKNGPYFLAIRDNKVEGGVYADSGNGNSWKHVRGTTELEQNVWYKIKMSYDGKSVNIYLNDNLEGSAQKNGSMPIVSQQVWIGWGEPGHNQYFKGILDELKISGI